MKKKILISAANGPIMKSLIIELKKRGFYVVGIDSSKIGVAQRFCNEFYHSPIGSSLKFFEVKMKKIPLFRKNSDNWGIGSEGL